jgi:2-methylcitrate dehydratase PrpD
MAKAGFIGHHDVLGGGRGYLKMMTGSEDIELREPLLNGTYAIEKSYTKPYAACRYCHPAIEAAIKLGKQVDAQKSKKSS